jgi:eukaryotic-like serine/threonine-protein kinase
MWRKSKKPPYSLSRKRERERARVRNMRIFSIIFILFTATALLSPAYPADWPAFRGNCARTGFYPDPVGIPSGKPVWKISLGNEIVSSPAVVDNVLYIGGRDSCIHAIDCGEGKALWKVKTGGWVDASPLVDGNRVVVGGRDSTTYVLDKKSGGILGRMMAGVQLSSPAITAGGAILSGLGMPGGGVAAYNGTVSLAKKLAGPQWSIGLPQFTYSSPAVHGQAVVIGATNGSFYGIDAGRQDTIWSLPTDGVIYLSTPAIDDATVYLAPGDEDRNIYAVSLLTGKVFWKNAGISSGVLGIRKALAKSARARLLPSSDLARLLLMSPSVRKQSIQRLRKMRIELPRVPIPGAAAKTAAGGISQFIPLGGMKTSSVAVGTENVFVIQKDLGYILTSDSIVDYKQMFSIYAFNKKNGVQVWNFTDWRNSAANGYCSSPVATEKIVYFGWGEGRVFALTATSGSKIWEDSLEGNILSSPAIADSRLYVATMTGNIYAYDLNATAPGLDFQTSTYCYPNPARGNVAHIQVYVNKPGTVDITLYNSAEKPVLRFSQQLSAGDKYPYDWDISHVANGVYFALIKVKYDNGSSDKKVLKVAVLK